MSKKARDPLSVAILLFSLMFLALMLFLLTAVVRRKTPARSTTPFVPPGWVEPTYPPPASTR